MADTITSRLGWECPACHRCYAPDVRACDACAATAAPSPWRPGPYWTLPYYVPSPFYVPPVNPPSGPWFIWTDGTGTGTTTNKLKIDPVTISNVVPITIRRHGGEGSETGGGAP